MVTYLEEYDDNVYQSGFTVLSAFFALDDWREDQELKIYAHSRIDRFLTSILKICRDWYRDSKYLQVNTPNALCSTLCSFWTMSLMFCCWTCLWLQSVSKIARFIEQMAACNVTVSSYFRIRCNEITVQWFQQYLSSHSHRRQYWLFLHIVSISLSASVSVRRFVERSFCLPRPTMVDEANESLNKLNCRNCP